MGNYKTGGKEEKGECVRHFAQLPLGPQSFSSQFFSRINRYLR